MYFSQSEKCTMGLLFALEFVVMYLRQKLFVNCYEHVFILTFEYFVLGHVQLSSTYAYFGQLLKENWVSYF